MLPDPFDVLAATLGPAVRVVELDDVRVVRTADRSDHAPGNAVHHRTGLPPGALEEAVADLGRRFPAGRARLVVPCDGDLVAASEGLGLHPSVLEVALRDHGTAPVSVRDDLRLAVPGDDRAWHGVAVLQRHAGRPGEDPSRGAEDERLRWWVGGLRQLVAHGRARVLRAERFGTPVGVGVLHWDPGAEVAAGHAGLAVLADVVVHPAHRGLGIARAVAEGLVGRHLADFPRAQVAAVAERRVAGDDAGGPPRLPSGWQPHARLLALTRT